jgi:hypothetical protein
MTRIHPNMSKTAWWFQVWRLFFSILQRMMKSTIDSYIILYLSNWNHKQQGKEKWRGKRSVWTSQGNPSWSFQGSPAKFSTHLHELMVWINIYQSLTKGPVMTWLASVVVPPARTMRINWHLKRRVFSQTITIAGWCFGTFYIFHILGIIIPFDFHFFQMGRSTTNQLAIQPRKWHQT